MGPKAFITCYVCFREFGSRSIPFHEPKCLERWRCSNRSLPPEKRSPTPVKPIGWKHSDDSVWLCTSCRVSVPAAKRGEHAASCFVNKATAGSLLIGRKITLSNMAAGATKSNPYSPKKGKENKNSINKKSSDVSPTDRGNADMKEVVRKSPRKEVKDTKDHVADEAVGKESEKQECSPSTSNKSVRPQTKILRRPTPNLKHPVIQVDSDESGDSSDKGKDDNSKRTKNGGGECPNDHKPKNFIMYNKYNVERNTKNSPKERAALAKDSLSSPSSSNGIPHPCNSCSRSLAPERLHSHSRRDVRSLMLKKTPSSEVKTPSPEKKVMQPEIEDSVDKDEKTESEDCACSNEMNTPGDKTLSVPKTVFNVGTKRTIGQSQAVCYICGKDLGNFPLSLHERKCLEKWKKTNGLLSPARRKPVPKSVEPDPEPQPKVECVSDPELTNADSMLQMDEMDPAWLAVQSQLVPCPSCSRTFFPERLPVHQRVCKGRLSAGQSLSRANSLREGSLSQAEEEYGDKQTIYVPCYICKKSFGSWVIQMHESQCLRKWRRENEKLPEHLQQQEPHKPQLVLAGMTQVNANPTEDVAWESHLQQLVPCQRCGRTFFPDRLQVHGRSCKGQVTKQQTTPRGQATCNGNPNRST